MMWVVMVHLKCPLHTYVCCYESKTHSLCNNIWDCFLTFFQVRCWEVQDNGQTVPKAQQMHTGPVLDVCWSEVGPPHISHHISLRTIEGLWIKLYLFVPLLSQDGSKVFTASCDKTAKMWDLNSNQAIQIAQVNISGYEHCFKCYFSIGSFIASLYNWGELLPMKTLWKGMLNLDPIRNGIDLCFLLAWCSYQNSPLDQSPQLQLHHDRQLGQNSEGKKMYCDWKQSLFQNDYLFYIIVIM